MPRKATKKKATKRAAKRTTKRGGDTKPVQKPPAPTNPRLTRLRSAFATEEAALADIALSVEVDQDELVPVHTETTWAWNEPA
jgi:hypothetical protein